MKAALIAVAVGVVIALGVGAFLVFRGDDGPKQTTYASQLSKLCVDARSQIEALGKPNEIPISKLYPGTVKIGRAFVAQARELDPPPAQAAAAKQFVEQSALYYDGLAYAYTFLTTQNNQVAFVQIVNGATANLDKAETAARELDAPDCALRPFE
jgi:hypothetical protein